MQVSQIFLVEIVHICTCTISDKLYVSLVEKNQYYIIHHYFPNISIHFSSELSGLQSQMGIEFTHNLKKVPSSFFNEILRLIGLKLSSVFSLFYCQIYDPHKCHGLLLPWSLSATKPHSATHLHPHSVMGEAIGRVKMRKKLWLR